MLVRWQSQQADTHKPRRHLALWSATTNKGVQITYPAITVHAQEGSAVLLGLNLSDANTPDEDLVFIQMRILPTSAEKHEEAPEAEVASHKIEVPAASKAENKPTT